MTDPTVSVSRSIALPAAPRAVWAEIGDFQALDSWHPVVARSRAEGSGDLEYRHLTTVDGAELTEQLLSRSEHGYRYRINSGPLPVAHYEATLEVTAEDGGCRVTWSSSFTPTAENAEQVIAGIYEAGFEALKTRFA